MNDVAKWRSALNDFRLKFGLAAYKKFIIDEDSDDDKSDTLSEYIGSMSPDTFCHPYVCMRSWIKNARADWRGISDRIISQTWRTEGMEKFQQHFYRWIIGYTYVTMNPSRGAGHYTRNEIHVSPAWAKMVSDIEPVIDGMLVLDVRRRRAVAEHTVGDAVMLKRHKDTNGCYDIKGVNGFIAWLPDTMKESIAFSSVSEAVAVRTSRGRMIRFIDNKLKG